MIGLGALVAALEGLEALVDLDLGKPATRVVTNADKTIVQLLERRSLLVMHPVQEPKHAVADDLLVACESSETGVAREQGAASAMGQGQRECVGQRQGWDCPAIGAARATPSPSRSSTMRPMATRRSPP